jgi:hypothetical protein
MSEDNGDVFADATDATRRFLVEGFVALWQGQTPTLSDLVDTGDDVVRSMVERLAWEGKLEVDAAGRLLGIHGLTWRPTRHRIEDAGRTRYTWCALDAIGIPAALGIDATAITDCPTCLAQLEVELKHGLPNRVSSFVLWLPTGPCDHLVNDFCADANLFCSRTHLAAWRGTTGARSGRELSLVSVVEIGRKSWADVAETLRRG